MSGFTRRYEIIEQNSPFYIKQTSILSPKTLAMSIPYCFPPPLISDIIKEEDFDSSFDIFNPHTTTTTSKTTRFDLSTFDPLFDSITITDLVQIESTPFSSTYKRLQRRYPNTPVANFYLQTLCDRVSELESKFDQLVVAKKQEKSKEHKKKDEKNALDRKYTAEIKDGSGRKYKWITEMKGDEKKKQQEVVIGDRKYKWIAQSKGKNDEKRTFTWKASIGDIDGEEEEKKGKKEKRGKHEKEGKKEKEHKRSCEARLIEIEDSTNDHGAAVLRLAFAKRAGSAAARGKKKELSPQDAAMMIQMTFRAYLIRRSQALRALRDLAVAKNMLKELRKLFHNFPYRSRVARDSEERQKFSEKMIVLLLTVDAIEGIDVMVRAAKRSMVDELEAMLDVVDPQPNGKTLLRRRRTFDMPSGEIREDAAEGVAHIVQMLDEENGTFEACL